MRVPRPQHCGDPDKLGTDRDEVSELRAAAYEGLAALGQPVRRRRRRRRRPNRDTWIDAA